MKIFVTRKIPEAGIKKLVEAKYDIDVNPQDRVLSKDELISFLKKGNYDGVFCLLTDKIDKDVFEAAGPQCKIFANMAVGFDNVDVAVAKEKKIMITNTPGVLTDTVAEHTFALILALSRNLHKAYVRTSSNDFSIEGLRGFDLRGKTLGVVGAGSIGVHVIKIAKGFGMEIMAFDSKPNHILTELLDFNYVPLDELLKKSDIITLHCPYNQFTHHLINMNNIKKVKKGALFINTARSGIIEPKALYYAIEKNIFSGAGLDVFEGEELLKEENQMLTKNVSVEHLETLLKRNILLRRENVIITPHIAFDSMEAIERILDTTVENIISFLEGKNYHKVI